MKKIFAILLCICMMMSCFPAFADTTESKTKAENVVNVSKEVPDGESQTENITVSPSGECVVEGDWKFSSAVHGPMLKAPQSLWIGGIKTEASVTYKPQLNTVGNVRVSVYMLYWNDSRASDVKYEIHHNGKIDEIHLNPLSYTESQWVTLGSFDFAGNPEEEFVKLVTVPTAGKRGNTRASTVMFEVLNSETGALWQTVYVTPLLVGNNKIATMKTLDKFSDMNEHWASYDVEYMANEGLVAGKGESTFDPDAQITRAEYVTILDRAMGYEIETGESYADVSQDAWYAPYIATAKANGLLNGLPTDDGFKPDAPITREDMALFTYNAIKATKKNDEWVAKLPTDFAKFADVAEISDYAKEALEYLVQTGIIKGMTETAVAPKGNATRAQGAVILKRFMQSFVWAGPPTDEEWVLTFNDEFSGNDLNWDMWDSQASTASHILSSRWPENVEVKDGDVKLLTKKENRGGKEFTTANIWVKPEMFRQSYGYWEARYKIADSTGVNNSFWMITQVIRIPNETYKFEIDINEGKFPNMIDTNYHSYSTGTAVSSSVRTLSQYVLSRDYHTYAVKWDEKELVYYVDGKEIDRKANINANIPVFPYLSTAITAYSGQNEQAGGTSMEVDYVRVWQYKKLADDPLITMLNSGNLNMPGTPADVIPVALIDSQIVDNKTYDGEIILDPINENGEWLTTSAVKNYNGGPHYWCKQAGATSTYYFKEVPSGTYKVYYWRTPHPSTVETMDFYLHQNGTSSVLGTVAMRSLDVGTSEPGWIEMGTVTLEQNSDAKLVYTCVNGGNRASGLKLVPVK